MPRKPTKSDREAASKAARALAARRKRCGPLPTLVECPQCHESMSTRAFHRHKRQCSAKATSSAPAKSA